MTAVPPDTGPGTGADDERMLTEIIGMLAEVTGEDQQWAAGVTGASALEGDLRLESVELTALGERLRRRYGDEADLPALIAGLEIYQIIELTVGDLVAYVRGRPAASPAASPAGLRRDAGVSG